MERRNIGATALAVGAVGLGCMPMNWAYTTSEQRGDRSLRAVHAALDAGVTLLDTADMYGPFTNELLLGRVLKERRADAFVATKCGLLVGDGHVVANGRPGYVRRACDASLRRLGTEVIDLYQLHRADPEVPVEETWGAMAELVTAGKVRALGWCAVGARPARRGGAVFPAPGRGTVRRSPLFRRAAGTSPGTAAAPGTPRGAHSAPGTVRVPPGAGRTAPGAATGTAPRAAPAGPGPGPVPGSVPGLPVAPDVFDGTIRQLERVQQVFPVSAVQAELSVWSPEALARLLPWCASRGVGFLAAMPLGNGFLTGTLTPGGGFEPDDPRARHPRFTAEMMAANQPLVAGLRRVAERHGGAAAGVTPAQVALAWTLAQGPQVVPVPGTKRAHWAVENARAAGLALTAGDLAEIAALPPARDSWD
ncbi:aldo/keto reductase [Streptomyces sp. LP05-1]|uniref:Aldo/keto reductase n=1 Tax=Streptomyces pyxinae TaxID=2970734 RepID=A0ABT2CJ88_9ACTN|nr:aldo/keto reductase [Streptomyces sp. LP05-1]MCS0636664.1 aldo/keto reductase [Streptomyces sp. LP05-1]